MIESVHDTGNVLFPSSDQGGYFIGISDIKTESRSPTNRFHLNTNWLINSQMGLIFSDGLRNKQLCTNRQWIIGHRKHL